MFKSKIRVSCFILALLSLAALWGCAGKVIISDTQNPTVQFIFPGDGDELSGDTVLITISASDDRGVARVDFWVDGSLNFSDPSSPYGFSWIILVFNDSTPHAVSAIAYDAAGNADTATINVVVRVAPGFHFISQTATTSGGYNLFVWGNYVALTEEGNGVEIFDISNPALPKSIANYSPGGSAKGVFVSGNNLFVAFDQEVHVLNVANPAAPVFRSQFTPPGGAIMDNVFVLGNYAYLAAKNSGIYILDVSNPDSLVQLGQYQVGGGIAYDVKVVDTLAYIAYGGVGMEIVNVKNPALPTYVSNYTPAGSASVRRLVISGNRAYLAMQNSGFDIVNVTNPLVPVKLGNYNTFNSNFMGADVNGSLVYLADSDQGVEIVDATNPAAPSSVDLLNTQGLANNLIFRSSFVYVADQTSLTILRYVP